MYSDLILGGANSDLILGCAILENSDVDVDSLVLVNLLFRLTRSFYLLHELLRHETILSKLLVLYFCICGPTSTDLILVFVHTTRTILLAFFQKLYGSG